VTQPASQKVNIGSDVTFTVTASGTPILHYQWCINGTNILDATGPALTLTNVQPNQAGDYSVVVSNMLGVTTSSNAVLRVNLPPIADASATASLAISCNNSNAKVVLIGSRSSDPDADPLQYSWFVNGAANVSATGAVAVVILPVGTNSIRLSVSDGLITDDQIITVEVITTAQAVERLIALVNHNVSKPRPLVATLTAALAAVQRGHCLAAMAELRAFQLKVRAQIARHDPTLAATLIQSAQRIIDALRSCCCGTGPGHGHGDIRWVHGHPDGRLHWEFPGTRGHVYIVQTSTDLVHWVSIGVATDRDDGTFEFDDAKAAQEGARFYRVVVP
jgi:hypothetical protein